MTSREKWVTAYRFAWPKGVRHFLQRGETWPVSNAYVVTSFALNVTWSRVVVRTHGYC